MILQLHRDAINMELWKWVETLKNDLSEVIIENTEENLQVIIDFDYDRIQIISNGINVIHKIQNQTQELFYNGIIIEEGSIFANDYKLKHYPFLDQFYLNGVFVEVARILTELIDSIGGLK